MGKLRQTAKMEGKVASRPRTGRTAHAAPSKKHHHIVVYTDGCSLGNPGPGGWAYILKSGPYEKAAAEGFRRTTNNRMELMAAIEALQAIKAQSADIDLYTDSQYVAKAFTEGWIDKWRAQNFAKRPNADLWRRLDELVRKFRVKFHWVRGHSGDPLNEACDRMAKEAAGRPRRDDPGYPALRRS